MKALAWFVIVCCLVGIALTLWRRARTLAVRQRESEARGAALLAEAMEAARAKSTAPEPGARD